MGASRLAVSTVFFLSLTLSSSRAAKSSCIQWRKPGESVKINCSITKQSEQEHLHLKFCEDFDVLQWNLQDTITIKAGWEPRVTTETTETTKPKELIITIANLTAKDTGYYHCQYKAMKFYHVVETSGAGSVLLVVHDLIDADETFPMILVVVLCGVILLLLSVLVMMWILRKMKSMRINAVSPVRRAYPSDVYEDMRSTCRR
ncbi:unnamed protein product [Arctogadus glacialis]